MITSYCCRVTQYLWLDINTCVKMQREAEGTTIHFTVTQTQDISSVNLLSGDIWKESLQLHVPKCRIPLYFPGSNTHCCNCKYSWKYSGSILMPNILLNPLIENSGPQTNYRQCLKSVVFKTDSHCMNGHGVQSFFKHFLLCLQNKRKTDYI